MEIIVRNPQNGEIPDLRHIFTSAFGKFEEPVFFDYWFTKDMCALAICDGVPAAAGYILPAGRLIANGQATPCAMIYALSTLSEYRGRGLGAEIVRKLLSIGHDAGFEEIVLCPSDDKLFEYYGTHTEFKDWFYVREERFSSVPADNRLSKISKITAREYGAMREKFLADFPHIELDLRNLEYHELLCKTLGGGFYCISESGGNVRACVAVEMQSDGGVWVKELLADDGYGLSAVSQIAKELPAQGYLVRTPVRQPGENVRRFGMIISPEYNVLDGGKPLPWYGLAFD